jgi:cyanophycin synthetase
MVEKASRSRSRDSGETSNSSATGRRRGAGNASSKKPPARADLRILESRVFRGPNFWSYEPCIRLLVDLGSLEEWPSNTIQGFNRGLLEMLPGLKDHSCSVGRAG